MFALLIGMALGGLIIGALGRLVVPGPNPMGIGATILVGWAGAFLGGLIGRLVLGWRYRYSLGLGLIIAVACTAGIVYAVEGRRRRRL